jgi:hypothetical protein
LHARSFGVPALAGFGLMAASFLSPGCTTPADPPAAPTGGQTFTLDYGMFQASVEPVLTAKGCDAGGDCHGGGIRGTLALSPEDAKDSAFDFTQVSLQVDGLDPSASPILLKPLAEDAGGAPHGFVAFTSTDDPGYQTILAWIQAGVFE